MELTLSRHPTTFADASEKSFPVVEEKEHRGSDGYKPELYIYWEPKLKENTNGLIWQYCVLKLAVLPILPIGMSIMKYINLFIDLEKHSTILCAVTDADNQITSIL